MNAHRMSVPIGPKPPRGEDLPFDDDFPMDSERHRMQIALLVESLEHAWRDRDDVCIAGDMPLYFSETQRMRRDFRVPDVYVVTETVRRERKKWVVWEEDGRSPDVVIEITSETTESMDRGEKKTIYEKLLRVPTYVIYDPFSARLDVFGLRAERKRYETLPPDPRGLVRCTPLGLWVGVWRGEHFRVEAPWLRWFDEAGEMLLHPEELALREGARADREAERARKAEEELVRLRDELKRRGG
jgi:Uma2 family endonuclease